MDKLALSHTFTARTIHRTSEFVWGILMPYVVIELGTDLDVERKLLNLADGLALVGLVSMILGFTRKGFCGEIPGSSSSLKSPR